MAAIWLVNRTVGIESDPSKNFVAVGVQPLTPHNLLGMRIKGLFIYAGGRGCQEHEPCGSTPKPPA